MPTQSNRISRKAYELPLLKSLMECGGSSVPEDRLYRLVAEKMGLVGREMEYDVAHAKPKWVYDVTVGSS